MLLSFFMKNKMFSLFGFFLVATFISFSSCSKKVWYSTKNIAKYNYQEVILTQEKDPSFTSYPMYPDGINGIFNLLSSNIKYPTEAKLKGISGKVIIQFVVGTDGNAKDFEVIQPVHPLLDNEAVRVLKLMKRWIPVKIGDRFGAMRYDIPVNFKLT